MPIGALIGAGTGIVSSILQKKAADKTAEQQAQAREAGITRLDSAAKTGMLGVTDAGRLASEGVTGAGRTAGQGVTDAGALAASGVRTAGNQGRDAIMGTLDAYKPYQDAGATAATQSTALTEAPVDQFSYDSSKVGMNPAYLFRQQEANKAMLANGAAFGNLQSGGFARDFQDRNQAAASQEYEADYRRDLDAFNVNQGQKNSRISQLSQLMGFGLNADSAVTGATGDAARLGLAGETAAGGFSTDAAARAGAFDTDAAAKAGMFGTTAAQQAAELGQRSAEGGADLLTGAGDARAVGTVNKSNAMTGIFGQIGKIGESIDWGKLFKRDQADTSGPALAYQGGG